MLTREEAIEITRTTADKNKCDPFYGHDEVGVFGTDEYVRICQAIYRRGVEDAAKVADAIADGWEKSPGNNPMAGYVASSNCAFEIRRLAGK